MNEMLGNRYFIARKYDKAVAEFEKVLSQDPENVPSRKKSIICYTQIGQVEKAFESFLVILKLDPDIIIKTDHIADDCPCPEIVSKFTMSLPFEYNSKDLNLILGMLWLYCDVAESLQYLNSVLAEEPDNLQLENAIRIIETKMK